MLNSDLEYETFYLHEKKVKRAKKHKLLVVTVASG